MTETAVPAELAVLIAAENAEPAAELGAATRETLDALVAEMMDLKSNIAEIKTIKNDLETKYDELRFRRLPDLMQSLGLVRPDGHGGFTHSSGAKISLRLEVFANYKKEYEADVFAWMRENGHADLIKETINAQTLKAFVKERVEAGDPLPAQITVTPQTMAVLTQPKESKE